MRTYSEALHIMASMRNDKLLSGGHDDRLDSDAIHLVKFIYGVSDATLEIDLKRRMKELWPWRSKST